MPGSETAPALPIEDLPVGRIFDGGLLYRWTYTLTKADALACLRLKKEPTTRASAYAAEKSAMAAHLRDLSRGPYYFDAPLDDGADPA